MTSRVGKPHSWAYYLRKHYVASEEVREVYGPWEAPDEQVAKQRYHKNHTHHTIYDFVETRVIDLKVFGQGHMLYLHFLKHMAVAFAVLSVCVGLPSLIIFLAGPWYPSSSDLERSTIGNFGLVSNNSGSTLIQSLLVNDASVDTSGLGIGGFGSSKSFALEIAIGRLFRNDGDKPPAPLPDLGGSKRAAIVALSVLDLLGALGFLVFSLTFIIWTRKLADKATASTVTIGDYSVRVRNLPPDVTEQELRKYFEAYGEVAQVDLAYACAGLIEMVMERKDTVAKQERSLAVLQRTAEAYPKVDEDLEFEYLSCRYDRWLINRAIKTQQQLAAHTYVVEAFVVYKEEVGRKACLDAQPRNWWRRWGMPREQRFRQERVLRVGPAPEPSDIKFENLEYSLPKRILFWLGSWCLKLLLLLVGFALVSIAPAVKGKLGAWQGGASVSDCNAYCTYNADSGVPSLNSTLRDVYRTCHETGVLPNQLSCDKLSICYECFCRMVLTAGGLSFADYCSDYKGVVAAQVGSQALAVFTIVAVNLLLPYVISYLSEKEKHQTRSAEARSTARALLIMYFLNTAVSIMLANAYFPQIRASLDEAGSVSTWLLLGIYSDLTPHWYTDVGRALLLSQIVGIPSRLAVILWDVLVRNFNIQRKWKCLTQRELNHAYDGPEFTLADKYGEHLGVVFVCLLFSGGMPLMYIIAFLSFVAAYWLEKYYLLKTCRWPITYNADLAVFVTEALPFAVLWHLAFALWSFSFIAVPRSLLAPGAIMNLLDALSSALTKLWANTNQLTVEQMSNRMAQQNAFHLFAALWLCAAVLFVFLTLDSWIRVTGPFFRWLARAVRGNGARVTPTPAAPTTDPNRFDTQPRNSSEDFSPALAYGQPHLTDDMNPDRLRAPSQLPVKPVEREESVDSKSSTPPTLSPSDPDSDVQLMGVPEFDLAVRSQLLIGPASYSMRAVAVYEEAFEDVEEEEAGDMQALQEKLLEHEDRRGGGTRWLQGFRRRALRQRAEDLAKGDMSKPMTRALLENKAPSSGRRMADPQPPPRTTRDDMDEVEEDEGEANGSGRSRDAGAPRLEADVGGGSRGPASPAQLHGRRDEPVAEASEDEAPASPGWTKMEETGSSTRKKKGGKKKRSKSRAGREAEAGQEAMAATGECEGARGRKARAPAGTLHVHGTGGVEPRGQSVRSLAAMPGEDYMSSDVYGRL